MVRSSMKIALAALWTLSSVLAHSLWPLPAKYDGGSGITAVGSSKISLGYTTSQILSDAVTRYNSIIANEKFTPPADYKVTEAPPTNGTMSGLLVTVKSSDDTLNLDTDESYTLNVPVNGQATLQSETVYGALRGLETYSQLILTYGGKKVVRETPVHIEDSPVLHHRGLMLDTSRNYYPLDAIKRTLDAMSYNKVNVFHWHIVDAQSWPVESKKHPELQAKGAYGPDMQYSYTDVQQIIQYGKARGIRIIPEFDMPGHSFIVYESHPDIVSCPNVQPGWDKLAAEPPSGQLNIAKPAAIEFAKTIIDEYAALFTDDMFHLGGDEVNRPCWDNDPDVQNYLKTHPNATVESLLADFYTDVHSEVARVNKTALSWEETLFHSEYVPPKSTIIQTWIDEQSIPNTVAKGYRSIASPASSYYLDCGHGAWLSNFDGNSWCDPYKSWIHIYNFDPWANITDSAQKKLIVGAEVALWSEQSDETSIDNYLWPRTSAMAETSWAGKTNSDGHVRTTTEVAQRLHDQRFRMVGRGIKAEPLQPLWCARNPGGCLLPS
ncbi:Glucosamine-6-phosphate isomerase (Glucosamine-6-phosphate deaminase) (GNPDA) (GlcN6P deaminase) [Coemansia sp. RSA 487]|nr:Glucosamine-6-phosphate isomerase (Glucosamine-6-phosphate deaminase) (GNPDA) (GlcN6P deaminase) [Coemansia sp. RSA 487]